MGPARYSLDAPTRRRLSAEASITDQTICRYLRGDPTNPSTVDRLQRAAKALKIALPAPGAPVAAGAGR
jgi:transcriptional regulator with XRE-family HTH domain